MATERVYRDALTDAVASVEMEGYRVNAKQKEIGLSFLNGSISKEEFIKSLLKECNQ